MLTKGKSSFAIFLVFLLFFCSITFPIAKERKVIRVAYPLQDGFAMKDEEGNRYGYDYDYLNQVAQYTGWEYEFVEVEGDINQRLTTLLEMLKNGEIDIMGSIRYSDELAKIYDYSSEPYGNVYRVLATNENSNLFDLNSLMTKKNLRIAILNSSKTHKEKLNQFANANGFIYDEVICTSEEELVQAVDSGQADAMLGVDASLPDKFYPIVKFSPDPFYFAISKGSTDIINELNQAMININTINPTLVTTLYNRYFSPRTEQLILTDLEKEFIKENPKFQVLIRDGSAPVQYLKDHQPAGIGKDILDYISDETGLQFEYTIASTFEEYKQLCCTSNASIIMGIPYESSVADKLNLNLSEPYINNDVILVTNKRTDPAKLSESTQATTTFSDQVYDTNSQLLYYESPEEIMTALDHGEVDYTYMNSYFTTYYLNKNRLRNILTYPAASYLRSQYAFGVTKSDDLTLLSILNKAIRVCDNEMNTFILKNASVEPKLSLQEFVTDHLLGVIITLIAIIFLIMFYVSRYYQHQLTMKKEVENEYQRFLMLSELSNEMTFSYDYRKDQLKISTSGINRLANQSLLEPFSEIVKDSSMSTDVERKIYDYLMQKKDISEEVELSLMSHDNNWYQVTMKVIINKEKNMETAVYAVGRVQNINKEKEERESLLQKSQTDYLTGIWNRAGAQELINNAIEKAKGIRMLILLDLDNFKYVNDTFGHFEGDQVLLEVSALLNEIFVNAIVARLGGDEFIIYKDDINIKHMEQLCKQALEKIKELPCMVQHHTQVTMSMGIVYTDKTETLNELIKIADKKLYEVKETGRNGYLTTYLS